MKQNYSDCSKTFVNKNYKFLDALTEIAMNLARLNYYPDSNSITQRSNIIDFAQQFCKKHQHTDWDTEDFVIEVNLYTDKIFIDWVNNDVIGNDEYDADEQKNLGEIARNLQFKQPEVKESAE